jgi:uncharacterized LabA/DUF88 family protein
MPNLTENAKVAIYWDFENMHACLNDKKYGRDDYYRNRFRPQEVLVEIEPVIDYAASIGDVVVHRAYCNWQFFGKYQERLNTAGMDLIQIFPRGWNAKNGADISLALDTLTDIQQHPHITHVIIISNDTDFVSLAQKVKQSGRTIIGVGLPEANRFWQFSCNEFKQYDALRELAGEPAPLEKPATEAEVQNASQEATQPRTNTLETARAVLAKGLRQMVDRNGENYGSKAGLKSLIKRLDPAFDERGLGFETFSTFLQHFSDIAVIVDAQHVAMVIPNSSSSIPQRDAPNATNEP